MSRFPELHTLLTGSPPRKAPDLSPIIERKKAQVKAGGPGSDEAAEFLKGVTTIRLAMGMRP